MPSSLLKFISWLLDDIAYNQAYSQEVAPDKLRKCLAIVESIVSVAKNSFTPFHLGLSLQVYHEFRSKHLVETLKANGFCAS